jgi:hypothetical protein
MELLNPLSFAKLLVKLESLSQLRLNTLWKALVLHFFPQHLFLFAGAKLFPDRNDRLTKTENPRDDFEVNWKRSSELPALDRVTVIQKGVSFDRARIDDLPGPIYAVNWPDKLERDDVVYATGDQGNLDRFINSEMFPIMFMEVNRYDRLGNYHPSEELLEDPRIQRIALYFKCEFNIPDTGMPATSGLACIVALSFLAQDIEVYGWDFYLDFAPAQSGYWKAFFKNFCNFHMELQSAFLEMAAYNWHYAYRYSQLPNFRNHGYLSGLERHPGINKRLDRVFYKSQV